MTLGLIIRELWKSVPTLPVDVMIFHWISKNFDVLVTQKEKSRNQQSLLDLSPEVHECLENFIAINSYDVSRRRIISFSGLCFWFWTPVEQLVTTYQTVKTVDTQKTVTRTLSLPSIFCILSNGQCQLLLPLSLMCASTLRCTHNSFTDTK